MRIFITGGNGQLGRSFYRLLSQDKTKIVQYSMLEGEINTFCQDMEIEEDKRKDLVTTVDITNESQVQQVITAFSPDIIINCAAHTAVDLCEQQEELAYKLNGLAPRYLAKTAQSINAKYVQVSTDYVFAGNGNRPYLEEDATDPQSVYGRTKLVGEQEALKNCDKTFVVRTAWVYGDGKNFVKTMLRLAKDHDTLTVVNDQFGSPTSSLELARAILTIIESDEYGIYHATCEESTSWYEFAVEIFKLAAPKLGKTVEVKPVTTEEYNSPAKRPAYSVLENKKLHDRFGYYMKNWKDALVEYMEEM